MNKYKLFSRIAFVVFMMMGIGLSAQSYLPPLKALNVVRGVVTSDNMQTATAQIGPASSLNNFIVIVGEELMKPLSNGVPVPEAIDQALAKFTTGSNPTREQAKLEVKRFYLNLLKY